MVEVVHHAVAAGDGDAGDALEGVLYPPTALRRGIDGDGLLERLDGATADIVWGPKSPSTAPA